MNYLSEEQLEKCKKCLHYDPYIDWDNMESIYCVWYKCEFVPKVKEQKKEEE